MIERSYGVFVALALTGLLWSATGLSQQGLRQGKLPKNSDFENIGTRDIQQLLPGCDGYVVTTSDLPANPRP